MSEVGQIERATQNRIVALFRNSLHYEYLGNWEERDGNSNVEQELLSKWLKAQGYDDKIIAKVLFEVNKAKVVGGSMSLYDANRDVYGLLRYGVKVRPDIGEQHVTIHLVDWKDPENNDFTIAEEVTIIGENDKRPDIVLYVNGIALGVVELKRSIVSVTEGIRQNLDSQKKEFIRPFFATIQLIVAGNDTEGVRYGVIETAEKYYLKWKEPSEIENPLDRAIGQLYRKDRFLEITHDFIVFDAGIKKICRHNQYFGVKAAQERVKRREGGVIWHTQGSGKSLTMIWLAKWIREHLQNSRVLILTDRTELDGQIEMFFNGVDEAIYRTKSGADLVGVLNRNDEWLMCSLIHKFGSSEEGDVDAFIREIEGHLSKGFQPKGEIFIFIDECHRTQSGKLHDAMKKLLPGSMLIGFTGTPLLKKDKKKSIEIFGPYIHTYKYDEAVRDGVVLDLRYEARDIDQNLTSSARVDQWFEAKTRGLSDWAKAQIKRRWGTMQKVLSSQDRLQKIVGDILLDMETRDRLMSGHGNAMLVCGNIYQACRIFEMFQPTPLSGKCAIITSYKPAAADIKGEESGEGDTETLLQYKTYRKMLAAHFDESEEKAVNKVEKFEEEVKKRFVHEPGQMKLLIVVDKLLTGFDAPPATYLYIDKKMKDHGLFQAICRVNRLDSEDKEYGHIVDYKDLFKSLERSVHEYTGEAFDGFDANDVAGLLRNRLEVGREKLEALREAVKALCEPVERPRETIAYIRYFCGKGTGDELKDNEPKRVQLYKLAGSLLRAYADLANEMSQAGYSRNEAAKVKEEVEQYQKVRDEIRLASGDYIDMKLYEPAMRHLLDTYIRAEESERLSTFDDKTLVELLVNKGADALGLLPEGIREKPEAVAEVIENNVRRVIIDAWALNPKYFEKMSNVLDSLIQARKREALDYKEYLKKLADLSSQVQSGGDASLYPTAINSAALKALFDNLDHNERFAVEVDKTIRSVKKAGWRGNKLKEREIRIAIKKVLENERLVDSIFEMVKHRHEY
jgi:type I restriction enzyme R subunit